MTNKFALETTCPHCGKRNEVTSSLSEFSKEPEPPRPAKDGDFGFCIGCGEWHVFEAAAPNGVRVPNVDEYMTIGTNPTMRKVRSAYVAATKAVKEKPKPAETAPGAKGRGLAKGHFRREFEQIALMGGRPCPPEMRAAIQAVYAVAVLDVFQQVDRAKSLGMIEGVAFLTALKRDAEEFAQTAGVDALAIAKGSVKP